jgi:hypothetical protein
MNEQLREMKGSSIQTDRLLDIQEKQLTEFQSQASDTRDLAVAAARQANAAGVIASNAASQSKATAALADIAVSQLGVMRGQFEISQRPWLSLTGAISGPLTFAANGANFIFRFTVHNSGQTPAVNFILLPELKALNLSLDVVAEAHNFCAASKTPFDEAAGRGTLFPGADRVESFPGQLTFSPVLIACVPYQASFDRSKWYHTAKIFNIERRIPGQVGIYAFRLYEPVEMQNMSLSTFGYPEMAR